MEFTAAVIKGIDPKDARDSEKASRQAEGLKQAQQKARERRTLGRAIRDFNEREIESSTRFTDKYKLQWITSTENHLPSWRAGALWNRPIDEVEPAESLDFVKDIQRKIPHTARKIRQPLDAVFEDSQLRKWCATRPTQAIRRAALRGAPSMKNKSLRALTYDQAPAFLRRLQLTPGVASKFRMQTGARRQRSVDSSLNVGGAARGGAVVVP